MCQEADDCVNTDPKRALKLYEQAANMNDEHGQRACADMYYHGKGCEINTVKALYWYEKSAEQGNVSSQLLCGYLYDKGIINGKSEKLFFPDDSLKREEFAKIVVNAFRLSGVSKKSFTDAVRTCLTSHHYGQVCSCY